MNTPSELTATITNETPAGNLRNLSLQVGGMTGASCVSRVEKVLLAVPGVGEAVVNLANERATVAYRAGEVDPESITAAIETAGYSARPVTGAETDDRERAAREAELAVLKRDLLLAAAFTVPLFLIAMLKMAPGIGGLMIGMEFNIGPVVLAPQFHLFSVLLPDGKWRVALVPSMDLAFEI